MYHTFLSTVSGLIGRVSGYRFQRSSSASSSSDMKTLFNVTVSDPHLTDSVRSAYQEPAKPLRYYLVKQT